MTDQNRLALTLECCDDGDAMLAVARHHVVAVHHANASATWSVPKLGERMGAHLRVAPGDSATHLFARWYASICVEGVWAQEFMGGGAGVIASAFAVPLVDIAGARDASLRVEQWDTTTTTTTTERGVPTLDMTLPYALVRSVEAAYERLHAPVNQRVAGVATHLGLPTHPCEAHLDTVHTMPLVWFALGATELARETTDWANACALFARALEVAERFAHPSQTSDESMLADVVALASLGWTYRTDRDASGRKTDWWTALLSFPDAAHAAFDCEDGSRACLELLLLLRALPLGACVPEPPARARLRRIQTLARAYTPYLTLCQLRGPATNGVYGLHIVLSLLDGVRGAITIESTCYASGHWHADMMASLDADALVRDAGQDATRDDAARATLRMRAPLSMVRDQCMYGLVYALFTCSAPGDMTTHSLLVDANGQPGVPAATLFAPRARVARVEAIEPLETRSLRAQLAPHLACAPASICPRAPDAHATLPPRKSGRIDVLHARACAGASVVPVWADMLLYHTTV